MSFKTNYDLYGIDRFSISLKPYIASNVGGSPAGWCCTLRLCQSNLVPRSALSIYLSFPLRIKSAAWLGETDTGDPG